MMYIFLIRVPLNIAGLVVSSMLVIYAFASQTPNARITGLVAKQASCKAYDAVTEAIVPRDNPNLTSSELMRLLGFIQNFNDLY